MLDKTCSQVIRWKEGKKEAEREVIQTKEKVQSFLFAHGMILWLNPQRLRESFRFDLINIFSQVARYKLSR